MAQTLETIYQFAKFAFKGIPKDAVCSVDVTNQCNLRCHHRIMTIKAKFPGLVEMPDRALELLRSENCFSVTDNCLAMSKMASWDVSGDRKEKCILGPKADCDRCGCGVPYWLQAVEDLDSETVGRMFGPSAGKYAKYLIPIRKIGRSISRGVR